METNPLTTPSEIPSKKSPLIFRVLIRLLTFLFSLFLLLAIAAFIVGKYYQDEVKEYVIAQLNKQLNTQVIVDGKDIDFTVLRNFPLASVDFKNVKALDAIDAGKKDTLFRAGLISVQFSLLDVFRKNYTVKKMVIEQAKCRLRIDASGKDNYHFWKSDQDTASGSFSFALKNIQLKDVQVSYLNKQLRQRLETTILSAHLEGAFSAEKYELTILSDLYAEQFKLDKDSYLSNKHLHTELALSVDNSIPSIKVKKGKINVENLQFEVYGNIVHVNNDPVLTLALKGTDMDIQSVLSLIPERYKSAIANYESEGELYLNASIEGDVSAGKLPVVTADFGMKNARINATKSGIRLDNVNLDGHYFSGELSKNKDSEFSLSKFSASIEQGTLEGQLIMKNLTDPKFSGSLKANLSLEQLGKLVQIDTIESLSGSINIDSRFSGEGKFSKETKPKNLLVDGTLLVKDMFLKLKNNALQFDGINGDLKFDNNDIVVNQLSGKVSSSDFLIRGFFRNVISSIFNPEEDLTVEASLQSSHIDLNELLASRDEHADSKYHLRFSEHINVELNSQIQQIDFRKFKATDINGLVKLKEKKLFADNVQLSTMNGKITTTGLVDGSDSTKILITCHSELMSIDVTKLFEAFENFGQSAITEKNIRGKADAKINFAAEMSPDLQMDLDKLYAAVDMTIQNGELNKVESMKNLSRFIELNELENVKFATLKNQIEIKNRMINIPKMEVKSSAINIVTSGTHSFNNDINYKVKLSLNELLSKKAKQAKKQNEEFGEVADDGLGRTNIFLSMTGTVDHPVIKYDSKSALQNVKSDLKVEKQNLKSILKDEFGLFKNDSTLNQNDKVKKEDQTKFKINWEESTKTPEKKELKKPKKPDEDDF